MGSEALPCYHCSRNGNPPWLAFHSLAVSWPIISGTQPIPGTRPWPSLYPVQFPIFPAALFLPRVWGAVALKPARDSFQGQVAQDLQLQGLALALSQPSPHPAGREG